MFGTVQTDSASGFNKTDRIDQPASLEIRAGVIQKLVYLADAQIRIDLNTQGDHAGIIGRSPAQSTDRIEGIGVLSLLACHGSMVDGSEEHAWLSMEAPLLQEGAGSIIGGIVRVFQEPATCAESHTPAMNDIYT